MTDFRKTNTATPANEKPDSDIADQPDELANLLPARQDTRPREQSESYKEKSECRRVAKREKELNTVDRVKHKDIVNRVQESLNKEGAHAARKQTKPDIILMQNNDGLLS